MYIPLLLGCHLCFNVNIEFLHLDISVIGSRSSESSVRMSDTSEDDNEISFCVKVNTDIW